MKKIYMMLLVFFLFVIPFMVRSQIVYTDINPDKDMFIPNGYDVYLVHPAYPAAADYIIRLDTLKKSIDPSPGAYQLRIIALYPTNEVVVSNDSLVKPLNKDDLIDANQTTWSNNNENWMVLRHVGASNYGLWVDVTKYIGLKMMKNGDISYGYVQMLVETGTTQPTVKILDMAYQKTPDKGIKAGQTVGIRDGKPDFASYILSNCILQVRTDKAVNVSISDISGH